MRLATLGAYARLMRLHRPIGSLLLLWPTLWALWLAADGRPSPIIVLVFVLGVILMRSAGCVINDYADQDFDGHVSRTKDRPLATGAVTRKEALVLFIGLCVLALPLVLWLNGYAVRLAFVAVILAASYPFMKRYTYFPQVYLGLAFGWGIPMVFAAQQDRVPLEAWLLLVANIFWTVAYDTAYAMVDREDDEKIGVKSTAIFFGVYDRFMVGLCHAITLIVLAVVGMQAHLGIAYVAGLGVAAGFAIYEQFLLYARQPHDCFRAFLNNAWFGGSIFVGIVVAYLGRSL